MSHALPMVNARQVLKALSSIGFQQVSSRGSHVKAAHADGRSVVVPVHGGRDIPRGTLNAILQQAGLSADEFKGLL
jgi:predicted RNA binding protein YcfA (HicA-like mRNA interferase family)